MNRAKKEDWKTKEFPAVFKVVPLNKELSKDQFEKLELGLIPEAMEDKWFIYLENDWLYFHRSWTGFCIFKLEIEVMTNTYLLKEVFVNREKEQYNSENEDHDKQIVERLIDSLLS